MQHSSQRNDWVLQSVSVSIPIPPRRGGQGGEDYCTAIKACYDSTMTSTQQEDELSSHRLKGLLIAGFIVFIGFVIAIVIIAIYAA